MHLQCKRSMQKPTFACADKHSVKGTGMRLFRNSTVVVLLSLACLARNAYAASDKDRNALEKTSEAIRAAFARGDVAAAMEHHPDVVKALAFHKQLKGGDAVAAYTELSSSSLWSL